MCLLPGRMKAGIYVIRQRLLVGHVGLESGYWLDLYTYRKARTP